MSTTSTIIRVKRKIEDNPQDALVLLCKRAKTDSEEISPSLFVFRGTVNNQVPILSYTLYIACLNIVHHYIVKNKVVSRSLSLRLKSNYPTNLDAVILIERFKRKVHLYITCII
jgi:hypothetical protein